jgi:hypothetical protein
MRLPSQKQPISHTHAHTHTHTHTKWAGGEAQGIGPEFQPLYGNNTWKDDLLLKEHA